jgi:hypothetical protein
MPTVLSVENWVPLKPVLGRVRDVAPILTLLHRFNQTESAILLLFYVINASEESFCFQMSVAFSVEKKDGEKPVLF